MKYHELKKIKPYRIVTGSSDGTFLPGEIVWVSENGDINSVQGAGCIEPSEVSEMTLDFEIVEAPEFEVIMIGNSEVCRKRNEK